MNHLSQKQVKQRLGTAAAALISSGMKVGLGSGTTSHCFIEALAERCKKESLYITATASSTTSSDLAKQLGIPILNVDEIGFLDITVDGADEIDSDKRMIKGGGGAHVREKIVATMSRELVIIVDESKLVSKLGAIKLPVEILGFGRNTTKQHLENLGLQADWRLSEKGELFLSDNGNYLLDLHFPSLIDNPEFWEKEIKSIPGVIDTGFFFHLAGRVIVGFSDGQITIRE
ncbi:MAG: ribose-5-phosphate isomerase RpiA [Simkania sp.]|nr:ribose-5-phosphate isomerase RpiA [Simkania sp.]